MNLKSFNPILITALLLFFAILPLIASINFMQNDDWNRYQTVVSFLEGDFRLLEVTATTFYTQGFIGMLFAKFFPFSNLPVLTLFFGCLNFLVFALILKEHLELKTIDTILVGLFLFFNPLHFYSVLGFMTEVYLLFFCLLSIYFYYKFIKYSHSKDFVFSNIAWVLAFFAKQWGIVFAAASLLGLIFKNKWKYAFYQFLIIILVLGYYYLFFPMTNEMEGQKSFEFKNFTSIKYIYGNTYAYFVYLLLFSFPFVSSWISTTFWRFKHRTKIYFAVSILLISMFLEILFSLTPHAWKQFPLYSNVFTEKGFFLDILKGESLPNIYSPFIQLFDEIGLVLLSACLFIFAIKRELFKRLLKYETFAIFIGLFLILGTPFVFDRYLLVLVPLVFLYFIKLNDLKINLRLLILVLIIQMFISLDFGIEFVNRNNLIWGNSNKIAEAQNISKNQILSTHAWNHLYRVNEGDALYEVKNFSALNPSDKVVLNFESKGLVTRREFVIVRLNNEK